MNKKLKVWMFTKWYPNQDDPQIGVFIRKHAKAIAVNNNIAILYIHSAANPVKEKITFKNRDGIIEVIVNYRRDKSLFRKLINGIRYISALQKGISVLKKHLPQPDIYHGYILTRTALIAWYLSKINRKPYVISEQWSGFLTGRFRQLSIIKKTIMRHVVKNADALTCVSAHLFLKMKSFSVTNENTHIIPNVIESSNNSNAIELKTNTEALIVADLVDDIKNISAVINAASGIMDKQNFILRIVGHGPDEKKLKALAEEKGLLNNKIFFEGVKTNEEVYQYLHRCDFLIMNSRFETFSLICAEAMSCGKPVLATKCGGPDEFVSPVTGILIEPGNSEELKTNLVFMLDHYRDFDGEKIKKYASEMFSIGKIAAAFKSVYDDLN